jgi:hypothetical protein
MRDKWEVGGDGLGLEYGSRYMGWRMRESKEGCNEAWYGYVFGGRRLAS